MANQWLQRGVALEKSAAAGDRSARVRRSDQMARTALLDRAAQRAPASRLTRQGKPMTMKIWLAIAAALLVAEPLPAAADNPRLTELDDCLAKAVAKQPPGRPIDLLARDLRSDCMIEFLAAGQSLEKTGKTQEQALKELFDNHLLVYVKLANPRS
jgi:hypothetical protein